MREIDLIAVPIPGADDVMAMQSEGTVWVALKPMCDSLGVDFSTQVRKLRRKSWAGIGQRPTPSAGGIQQTTVIDRATIPMWLATIDERRVADEVRPKLIAYQREACKALDAYFSRQPENEFDVLRLAIDRIEAARRQADEARAIAERTEARLDGIEGRHDWFSSLAYSRLHDLDTSLPATNRLGRFAAKIGRRHGIAPYRAQHAHYGWVNSFPNWVWDQALAEMREAR